MSKYIELLTSIISKENVYHLSEPGQLTEDVYETDIVLRKGTGG
jgi:hypothetical protein